MQGLFYIFAKKTTMKIKRLLTIAVAVFLTACSTDDSVDPLANIITLATQADVDAFANLGITATTKAVVVGPLAEGATSNISNLEGLHNLTNAQDIYIGNNPLLTSLKGLENLKKVNNTFYILNNKSLTSLQALQSLTQVNAIAVESNNSLTDVKGLESLTTIQYLSVSSNSSLQSLQGVNNLTTIEDKLVIANNALLPSLNGLDKLTKANLLYLNSPQLADISKLANTNVKDLYIYSSKLKDLEGLSGLTSINSITLQDNALLESLNGLTKLNDIKVLILNSNNSLSSLSGLESLTTIDGTGENIYNVQISGNTKLTSLDGLQNAVTKDSRITITNNIALKNLCALQKLTTDSGFNANYFIVRDNGFNPTAQNIQSGNCSLN